MGFLLGLEHASLTMATPICSKNSDNHHTNVRKSSGKHKETKKANLSKQTKNETEQLSAGSSGGENSFELIHQCLKRKLSSLSANSDSSEKLSLVKINKATSQIVSGTKYTIAFDAKDEISGRTYSSEAIIVAQPWASEDPSVVDFKCTPRASI